MIRQTARCAAATVLLLWPPAAAAESLFASPPHFLALAGHEQVVFFLNEPAVGAIASRNGTDSVEVVVPRAVVDPTLRGVTFHADEGATTGATTVVLAAGARGNAAIRITTAEAMTGVHAYSESDPPRLIVDLAAGASPPTAAAPAPHHTPAPAGTSATAIRSAAQSTATPPATTVVVTATAPRATASPVTRATATTIATVSSAARATVTRIPSPRPSPAVKPLVKPELAPLRSTVAVAASAPPARDQAAAANPADPSDGTQADGFPCAWRRIVGVPFCAPDAQALAYAAAPPLTALAEALGDADGTAPPPAAPAGDDAGALYLAADREFVTRAASRRLLPAIEAYRRALRRAPAFFDAPRARLNIALAYRTLGFEAELGSMRDEAGGESIRPIVDGLAGDLARDRDMRERARSAYASADAGGGAGPCLAARGRAALALTSDPPRDAAAELARLPDLCPAALLGDMDTVRVQARRQIVAGEPSRALATLDALRRTLGPAADGALLDEVGAAAVAAGDTAAARDAYTQLVSGRFGVRLAARGTLGLARVDAASGDVAAGFRRLSDLAPDTANAGRRRFALDALLAALHRGADQEAVTIVAEHDLALDTLAVDDQIRMARAFRTVALPAQGAALLRRLGDSLGTGAPDAWWEERGAVALATGAASALAVADEWLRTRGSSGAALALRARALAALGQSAASADVATHAIAALDPVAARALRLDVARRVRVVDLALAGRLAREALADESIPALAAPDAAMALRIAAEAAEAVGDDAAALAAYSALSARYADQPSAAGATYRVARLTAGAGGGAAATAAYAEVARSKDVLERRVGSAAQAYEAIVRPFENRRETP